jgi:D-aminoacyl-tRNA deacylase
MRLLIQRVTRAQVRVAGAPVSAIEQGLLVLVGVGHDDTPPIAEEVAAKCVGLRIFRDAEGRTNLALGDVGGAILAVSQFTLFADTSRGRRPSFLGAAPPELGERLYERFVAALEDRGVRVAKGIFGAEMEVELVNDGPLTIWLDSAARTPERAAGV